MVVARVCPGLCYRRAGFELSRLPSDLTPVPPFLNTEQN